MWKTVPPTHGILSEFPAVQNTWNVVAGFEGLYPVIRRRLAVEHRRQNVASPSSRPYLEDILQGIDTLLNMSEYACTTKDRLMLAHHVQAARLRDSIQSKLRVLLFSVCKIDHIVVNFTKVPMDPVLQDSLVMINDCLDKAPKSVLSAVHNQASQRRAATAPKPPTLAALRVPTNAHDDRTVVYKRC